MTSMFNKFECNKVPQGTCDLEFLEEIADSLTGECGRKLPQKFRYYHVLKDILGVRHMGSLFNRRVDCIWSLYNGVFKRD